MVIVWQSTISSFSLYVMVLGFRLRPFFLRLLDFWILLYNLMSYLVLTLFCLCWQLPKYIECKFFVSGNPYFTYYFNFLPLIVMFTFIFIFSLLCHTVCLAMCFPFLWFLDFWTDCCCWLDYLPHINKDFFSIPWFHLQVCILYYLHIRTIHSEL